MNKNNKINTLNIIKSMHIAFKDLNRPRLHVGQPLPKGERFSSYNKSRDYLVKFIESDLDCGLKIINLD